MVEPTFVEMRANKIINWLLKGAMMPLRKGKVAIQAPSAVVGFAKLQYKVLALIVGDILLNAYPKKDLVG